MANRWQEEIAEIAMSLWEEGEKMTFNQLADQLGHKRQLMGNRVGSAYKVMKDEGRHEAAVAIAETFVDSNGNRAW